MAKSLLEIYLHFVWATRYREPIIPQEWEDELYFVIRRELKNMNCETLAVNGMPDHVHLLVRIGRSVSVGRLMNQVKGVSSSFLNDRMFPNKQGYFRWQKGYGAFSVSLNHVERVASYIREQKIHHATGTLWPRWEKTPAENEPSPDSSVCT